MSLPAADATARDEAGGGLSRARQLRLAVATLVVLGVCAAAISFVLLAKPRGVVRGRALGAFQAVLLSDLPRQILVEGELDADGRYVVTLPRAAREPMVLLRTRDGGPFVESGVLSLGEQVEVPPLALWATELRIRSADGRVRLDWSPIPEGEGYPGKRRYSVLFRFTKPDGANAETTVLSEVPHQELPLSELKELLRDRDPRRPEVRIELRAFDPTQQKGPLWVGHLTTWSLPSD